MKKAKLERGRHYGRIKTVTARRGGCVVAQIPFKQLVKEVADDPNFSLAGQQARRHEGHDAGAKSVKANPTTETSAPQPKKEEFDEAVSLLRRVRPHLSDTQRAGKLKAQIEGFLDRVVR